MSSWIPDIVSRAKPGCAQLLDALGHVLAWVLAIGLEIGFQSDYTTIMEKNVNKDHWVWGVQMGSWATLGFPFILVLVVWLMQFCGREIEPGGWYSTVSSMFPTLVTASLIFTNLQFVHIVLLEVNGTAIKLGAPFIFVFLVLIKCYLTAVVKENIDKSAIDAKIHRGFA